MSRITEEIRSKATEYYTGNDMCAVKSMELLKEVGLPNGLLPLKDIEECGILRDTGFVWLKQKNSTEHKFEKVGKLVSYAPEGKIKNLTGVKTKEFLMWVSLKDIYLDNPPTGKLTFQTPKGLYRTFPASAFEIEEEESEEEESKEVKDSTNGVAVANAVEVKEV
ncbi:hypothetical protein LguiB_006402 [Lonicera macranthoides]